MRSFIAKSSFNSKRLPEADNTPGANRALPRSQCVPTRDSPICPMRPRTQTTRTNHLSYDVGSSRKIPDGALARATTTECLKANNRNVFTRFTLTLLGVPWAKRRA